MALPLLALVTCSPSVPTFLGHPSNSWLSLFEKVCGPFQRDRRSLPEGLGRDRKAGSWGQQSEPWESRRYNRNTGDPVSYCTPLIKPIIGIVPRALRWARRGLAALAMESWANRDSSLSRASPRPLRKVNLYFYSPPKISYVDPILHSGGHKVLGWLVTETTKTERIN